MRRIHTVNSIFQITESDFCLSFSSFSSFSRIVSLMRGEEIETGDGTTAGRSIHGNALYTRNGRNRRNIQG